MSDKQDADSFELDELRWQRRAVQEEKKLARKEHDKWCANLKNLRGSLVRERRLLVEKMSTSNYRRTFFGRSVLIVSSPLTVKSPANETMFACTA